MNNHAQEMTSESKGEAIKKPAQYELKKWLCENWVVGLRLHYYATGTDTSDTDWELTPSEGKPKRVKAHAVCGLVDIRPDWVRVLQVKDSVQREIKEYDAFAKKEARDLSEYERLKRKFDGEGDPEVKQ